MATTLQETWQQVTSLLKDGLSIIPVRDKPQIYKGKEYTVKSAYPWGKWQKERITEQELWFLMTDKYDTTAVAIVGGAVSGNLEIIDIDVKNWPGIDAKLFQELQLLYPTLFASLRINKTPSGGYHIFYRVSTGVIPGNKKLAKKEGSKEAAIETRGEGGYVVAPPSLGYTIHQSAPIPTISWEDRCSIISICESYNQVIKTVAPFKATKNEDRWYSVNPFEDFNQSSEAEGVLITNGWTESDRSSRFIWFTRPDKGKGVSASFNLQKRIFYIFTSSTQFEPDRGYNPATALSILQFDGNRSRTYTYLVQKGYGKVRPSIESKRAEIAGRTNKPLPANFSPQALQQAADIHQQLTELHPYGVYWKMDEEEERKLFISRELFIRIAGLLGFYYHTGNVVRLVGMFIYKIDERQFQDAMKVYIKEPDQEEYEKICDAFEAFMQKNGAYSMRRLPILDTSSILTDTADISYKFFTNGLLTITASTISFIEYDTLTDVLIWHYKIQQRDYNRYSHGRYIDFINKAIVTPAALRPILGYLAHEYKDETTAYIIVLTEQCPDPKQGGGSGKNVLCNLLNYTTTYTSKPGVQAKMDEKFFQSWNGQRIFGISDVPKNFDFSFLKEPSSGTFIWKKLFKDEIEVSNADAPKFIVQTNFSFDVSDGGLRRRIIPVEFTDFFTRCGGIDVHYGIHFPRAWTIEDWGSFDTYIAECIQCWLQAVRKLSATALTETGWEKQFRHTYGNNAIDFIELMWPEWITCSFISNQLWKEQLDNFYRENDIPIKFHIASKRLYEAVTIFSDKKGYVFMNNQQKRNGLETIKGKCILEKAPF